MAEMQLANTQLNSQLESVNTQLESANSRLDRTSLLQLLEVCHEAFVDNLHVELDPKKAATGTTTSVTNKIHPKKLKPWVGFPERRKEMFDRVSGFLQTQSEQEQRYFQSREEIKGVAGAAGEHRVSCEQDLRNYHQPCVESFVTAIIKRLIRVPEACSELRLGQEMTFENHTHCVTDNDDDGEEIKNYRPKDTDQLCIKHYGHRRVPVAINEMKPPHKATAELLNAGLHQFDDVRSEVVDRNTEPSKNQERFQKQADKFVAMIITQTYSYMVRAGISHGAIITGKAMIFLLVEEQEPHTVYFYHADPKAEVIDELTTRKSFPHECTAIAQLTAFSLMAHRAKQFSQAWRQNVDQNGPRWIFTEREPAREIPLEVGKYEERPQSACKPRREITAMYLTPAPTSKPSESPKPSTPAKSGCERADGFIRKGPDGDDDPDSEFDPYDTPTKNRLRHQDASWQPQGKLQGNKEQPAPTSRGTAQKYAYCSHACLKGLVDRTAPDTGCPNFKLHPQRHASNRHALTRPLLARLLRQQLAVDLDNCCIDLQKEGRTGMLFKLTLLSHGYTLVGKGTSRGFMRSAKHEGRVYSLLKERQGKSIPVYLGNIDLIQKWIGGDFDVVHMLLMSWAGESVALNVAQERPGQLLVKHEVKEFRSQCMAMGIHHQDNEYRNILWEEKSKQIMFIDFDMTILFNLRRPPSSTVRSGLYRKFFGSCTRAAALEYIANQEEHFEWFKRKDPSPVRIEGVPTESPMLAHAKQSVATSQLEAKARAKAVTLPAWLSADEHDAVPELDTTSTVTTDIAQDLEDAGSTPISPPKAKALYSANTKQIQGITFRETGNSRHIYIARDGQGKVRSSVTTLDKSIFKHRQQKPGRETDDDEDKENVLMDSLDLECAS
ncbi:MAG: hypothetical protein Q9170_006793 [Blastenia crenularia]